ncbi:MAG TPA: carboxypeptidase-like regulatory domain-containing protein [Candidatus Acidoferrum sp.]|jgi:hypothetical protein
MMKIPIAALATFLGTVLFAGSTFAQTPAGTGTLQVTARITPTAARPEPVRQFTFYILSKSYEAVSEEVEAGDVIPPRNDFIDGLKVSPELKEWLKAHEILDLTMPGLDKALTADDVIHVPEFLLAYQRSNSGGVTNGIPKPKYKDADKDDHPEKYEKEKQEYYTALRKFIRARPETMSGMELELDGVNPERKWAKIVSEHKKHIERMAPDVAQTKYLVAKADTDLDGRAGVSGLPPGSYWVSSLNFDADAGDTRVRWDVPVAIQPGQTTHIDLTNLNAIDAHASAAVTAP